MTAPSATYWSETTPANASTPCICAQAGSTQFSALKICCRRWWKTEDAGLFEGEVKLQKIKNETCQEPVQGEVSVLQEEWIDLIIEKKGMRQQHDGSKFPQHVFERTLLGARMLLSLLGQGGWCLDTVNSAVLGGKEQKCVFYSHNKTCYPSPEEKDGYVAQGCLITSDGE